RQSQEEHQHQHIHPVDRGTLAFSHSHCIRKRLRREQLPPLPALGFLLSGSPPRMRTLSHPTNPVAVNGHSAWTPCPPSGPTHANSAAAAVAAFAEQQRE